MKQQNPAKKPAVTPKKPNPLFEVLNAIQNKNYGWLDLSDDARNKYSQFMINRFLCSYDYLIPLAEQLSTQQLDNEAHFNILIDYVQHTKHYFNYNLWKSSKQVDNNLITATMKQYDIGPAEAQRYLNILNEEQKTNILNKWTDFLEISKNT